MSGIAPLMMPDIALGADVLLACIGVRFDGLGVQNLVRSARVALATPSAALAPLLLDLLQKLDGPLSDRGRLGASR